MFSIMQWQKQYSMGVTLAAGNLTKLVSRYIRRRSRLLRIASRYWGGFSRSRWSAVSPPYIVGERTPYTDSTVRGSFRDRYLSPTSAFQPSGLEAHHFSLKDSQLIMEEEAKRKFSKIVSVGGVRKTKSGFPDAGGYFAAEITTLSTEQGPGMGPRC